MARIVHAAQQWLDNNGDPLNGGSLEFYEPGTSTPKVVYSDAAQSTSIGATVNLDSAGRATAFGVGSYKIIVKDSSGTTLETRDGVKIEATIIGSFTSTITNDDGSNVILGGTDHSISSASATNNGVIGGGGCTLSGAVSDAACVGGGLNYINGSGAAYSAIVGGQGDSIDGGSGSVCVGGFGNKITSDAAAAFGENALADKDYQIVHGNGDWSLGQSQTSQFILSRTTTDATPAELFITGTSGRLAIPTDTTWGFDIMVVARRTDADNESAFYRFEGCIDNNAGTTAMVGSVVAATPIEDDANYACAVTADNTNDALIITATGVNSKTIRWVAFVRTVEVTG